MRLRLKGTTTTETRPFASHADHLVGKAAASGSPPKVSQRAFLKVIGLGAGLGIAGALAPAGVVHAQTVGDPDTYLNGQLFGPGPSATSTLSLVSQLQSTSVAESVQLWIYPKGSTTLRELLAVTNVGSLDLKGNPLMNAGPGSVMASGANFDLANNGLLNVASIGSPPSGALPSLILTGYAYVDQQTSQAGTWRWFGSNASAQLSVDNAGNLTTSGALTGSSLVVNGVQPTTVTAGPGAPAGNTVSVEGATGGKTTANGQNGGNGGSLTLTAGPGGVPGPGGTGGKGGNVTLQAGAGANGSNGGNGGNLTLQGGSPGSGQGNAGLPGNVLLASSVGYVGVGTPAPTDLLSVGAGNPSPFSVNSLGLVTAAGLTSAGTITFPGLGTGVVHANASGVLSSSPVTLTTDVTGVLPIANGGTNNATPYSIGSVIFADGTTLNQNNGQLFWDNTNYRLGIGATVGLPPPLTQDRLHLVGTLRGEWDSATSFNPVVRLHRLASGAFDGTSLSIDVGMGQGQANLVAGAEINSAGTGYTYLGSTRGAARIELGDGALYFYTGNTVQGTINTTVNWSNSYSYALMIDQGGHVGIWEATPTAALHLGSGSIQVANTKIADGSGCYYA